MRCHATDRPHARRLVSVERRPRIFVSGTWASVRASATGAVSARRVRDAVRVTLNRAAPHVTGDVGVLLTDDRSIRLLNKRFRGIDKATDVLAFPLGDGLTEDEPFGDVVISMQTARRQARAYGARLSEEVSRLLVHGTLHLCGYDHHERRDAARMFGLTRRLLAELHRLSPATTRKGQRHGARRKSRRAEKPHRPASKPRATHHA